MPAVLTFAAIVGFLLSGLVALLYLPQLATLNVATWLAVFGVLFCAFVLLALARIVALLER